MRAPPHSLSTVIALEMTQSKERMLTRRGHRCTIPVVRGWDGAVAAKTETYAKADTTDLDINLVQYASGGSSRPGHNLINGLNWEATQALYMPVLIVESYKGRTALRTKQDNGIGTVTSHNPKPNESTRRPAIPGVDNPTRWTE